MADQVNVIVGTVIVAWLLAFCVFIWFDVRDLARAQLKEEAE